MYDLKPNLIIGFHGCDELVCHQLLTSPNEIVFSKKPYDWLGHGMYFWESDPVRAYEWAKERERRKVIRKAAVIGAVLDLNCCCDLMNRTHINMLKDHYDWMKEDAAADLPVNRAAPGTLLKDRVIRELDCSVIEFMHSKNQLHQQKEMSENGFTNYRVFDSVRGVFIEGEPVYEGGNFHCNTHIQICIRNSNCILGFFLPRNVIDQQNLVIL